MGAVAYAVGDERRRVTWPARAIVATAILPLCALLSLGIAQGAWIVVGAVFAPVALAAVLTLSVRSLATLWIVGTPTIFTYINNVVHVIPVLTAERLLFVLLVAMLVLPLALHRARGLALDGIEKAAALFLLIAALSLANRDRAHDLATWMRDGALLLTGYAMPLGAYAIARRISLSPARVDALMALMMAAGAFLGLVGIAQVILGLTIFDASYLDLGSSGMSQNRAYGTMGGAAEYGTVVACTALFGWYCVRRAPGPAKLLVILAALLACAGLGLSKTRAPWLAFLLALVLLAVLDRRARPVVAAGLFAGVLALLAALPFLAASGFLEGRVLEVSPIYNRVALWATTLNMLAHHPLLGIGFGAQSFLEAVPTYLTSLGDVGTRFAIGVGVPHNEFLHVLVLVGVPGFFFYMRVIVGAIGRVRKALASGKHDDRQRDLAVCVALVWLVYIVNALVVDFGPSRYVGMLLFFMTGLLRITGDECDDRGGPVPGTGR